jgi:hypothetical protein
MVSIRIRALGKVLLLIVGIVVVGVGVASCNGGSSDRPHDDSGSKPHTH